MSTLNPIAIMAVTCLTPTELQPALMPLYLVDTFDELIDVDVSGDDVDPSAQPQALVAGNAAIGDGGGGHFVYVSDSTKTTNGFSVSDTSLGTGRWVATHGIRKLSVAPAVGGPGQPGDYFLNGFHRYDCIANATWRRVAIGAF